MNSARVRTPRALTGKKKKKMKLSLLLVAAITAGVEAMVDIKAGSLLGRKLLSKARNLEENENAQEEEDVEFKWVASYSLKFQGCHHIQQWNDQAQDAEDVKIQTRRLVRFRLCPNTSCSDVSAGGCNGGFGDYVLDMQTYVQAYFEAKKQATEYECEVYLNSNCNCEDNDDQGDDFNKDECEYDCYYNANMNQCIDRNPYEDDENRQEQFEADRYLECAQFEINNEGNDGRRLEEAEGEAEDEAEDEDALYIGPYCAEQGGAIFLGMFSDDTCTEFADDYAGMTTYKELTGETLPYSATSIVDMDCFQCLELQNNENDDQDGDHVSEQCEQIYKSAGKCEEHMPSGMIENPNNAGCTYIEGIKIVRQDGIVDIAKARANPVATAFIVIFAMAFAALGFYVWYLRTRLGAARASLL